MDLSFFIVRCITNDLNAFYWKINYDRIRELYPDAQIFVVDDFSKIETYKLPNRYTSSYNHKPYTSYTNYQLQEYGKLYPDLNCFNGDTVKLYNHWEKYGKFEKRTMPGKIQDTEVMDSEPHSIWEELPNLTYIKSEFPGRGEILGYYYFHKLKPTNTATWTADGVRRVNKILKGKFEEVKKEYELLMEKFHYNDMLYNAKFGFEPIIGETYHLYKNKKEELFLSIIEPNQWDLEHKGSFRLNSDKMWEKVEAISKQED